MSKKRLVGPVTAMRRLILEKKIESAEATLDCIHVLTLNGLPLTTAMEIVRETLEKARREGPDRTSEAAHRLDYVLQKLLSNISLK